MDTIEIQRLLKKINHKIEFNVFAANELPIHMRAPTYLISNLDTNTGPGSHWVAIHIDINGIGEYFDSYGRKPTNYHKTFLQRNTKIWFYNNKSLQNFYTSVCGEYSLVYLYFKYIGVSMKNFVNLFFENTLCNDLLIKEMFKSIFFDIS